MKTRLTYVGLGAVLALVLVFGALALQAQSGWQGQRWEYLTLYTNAVSPLTLAVVTDETEMTEINEALGALVVEGNITSVADQMDHLGSQGWELVTTASLNTEQPSPLSPSASPVLLYFRRPAR